MTTAIGNYDDPAVRAESRRRGYDPDLAWLTEYVDLAAEPEWISVEAVTRRYGSQVAALIEDGRILCVRWGGGQWVLRSDVQDITT